MTGVHALHVTIGIGLILIFAARACFTNAFVNRDTPVDLLGLYWHFVDIVWVFLFPQLYLTGSALLGLLALTIVASYLNLGVLNPIVTASISVASTVLIILFYMHVRRS